METLKALSIAGKMPANEPRILFAATAPLTIITSIRFIEEDSGTFIFVLRRKSLSYGGAGLMYMQKEVAAQEWFEQTTPIYLNAGDQLIGHATINTVNFFFDGYTQPV